MIPTVILGNLWHSNIIRANGWKDKIGYINTRAFYDSYSVIYRIVFMKPCNGYTIDVIVNLPIADLNCALIWSLSIVLKVNWNPTTGKIFFMSTCVYLFIFLANDLLPLYLTEKSVKQLPQLYSKIVSVFLPFSKLFPCSHDTLVYFLFTSLGVACGHSCFFLR